ncbi:SUF system NifU family Fe-S cluster assembly protein [Spiroplasma endosymbiont of Anurida maritima]|uniref:Fe-S cluster assembly sulfur transfer protein SufU n=1 Tax=Spiroplasma endosymbiont of Anurida maritima TaxID=2967972 RepID=UPI0036D309B8
MNFQDPFFQRQIIIEHYATPNNQGLKNDKDYQLVYQKSDTCMDNFQIELKAKDNIILDINFEGQGCSISTASLDIMINSIENKSFEEANKIIDEYKNMLTEKEYNIDLLKELLVFQNVYKQPQRLNCAQIGINGLLKLINGGNLNG